ncbi:NAD(P)/FAD-dependent oxidoreductase [Atlantibacter subterraneus]|uniref:NAD(P)/FAD-dependent oxidoreductase n=1 Tax=Atlantibacter subterraneus TaxID=255519 RepID=UPI001181EF47|nr:NAD(P)/FAD-dependent oxidoreductase [Atlantibacter subterranea]QFH72469.1 NAD(P)/FAD-dependent oxidoreductase [Enterobacter sp. E76]TSJ50837.1 NAD(P)/FAD-dependent oxidoreductase [Atlantibacter subterranea]UTJ48583.1 NAD(P)/FAD-dependent oxidoreductase [Atlantibacter subterranea]
MTQLIEDVDVVVIGGGVVGCAMFRRFTLMGSKVLLLEKGGDILSGASKANSAILHTGFDAPTGSLELQCMQAGYQEYMDIHHRMNLPLLKTTAIVVAWTEEQLAALPGIVKQAHDNGVLDVTQIDAEDVYNREPNLAKGALGGVYVPGEYVIDPWSSPLAYVTQAVQHGGKYRFNCGVTKATRYEEGWELETTQGAVRTRLVINCAGNHGDLIDGLWRQPDFEIRPRKGQFLVYDKAAAAQINAIILPVPTPTTKGVLLCRTIFGNMILGPTAEEQQDREHAEVNEEVLKSLIEKGSLMLPSLTHFSVTATYAGLRPATEKKEYRIYDYPNDQWISVGGIRSTGLTAALGIAAYVEELYQRNFSKLFELSPPTTLSWPHMPMLSEYEQRDYSCKGNGGVICHCELVTRRELEAVFDSAVPPECIGGLRRRTRVMMGRCNGFFCSNHVAEIVGTRLDNTLVVGKVE